MQFSTKEVATQVSDSPHRKTAMPDQLVVSETTSGSPASGPSERSYRYQTLDAWRGLACVLLVIYHSTMHVNAKADLGTSGWSKLGFLLVTATKQLNVGVPIFFVISGYCIMATLDARRRNGDGLGVYVWRRLHRIYPPYWVALLISALVIGLGERFVWPGLWTRSSFKMNSPLSLSLTEWLGNLTLTESWRYHLTGGRDRYLIGHAWTLCSEEQFYAIAGMILFLAPRRMFQATLAITVSIPFIVVWAYRNGLSLEGTVIGGEWFFFAAGIAAYYRNHHAGPVGSKLTFILLAVSPFLPLLDSRRLLFADPNLRFNWVLAMMSALLLTSLHRYDAPMSQWRCLRPLSYCGKICYSLYLIHPLVTTAIGHAFYRWGFRGNWETVLVTVPVSMTLSLAFGAGFFYLIERHFLNSNHSSRMPTEPWACEKPAMNSALEIDRNLLPSVPDRSPHDALAKHCEIFFVNQQV